MAAAGALTPSSSNLMVRKGTALKSAWSLQKPIYDDVEFLRGTHQEHVAFAMIQEAFNLFPYKHSKRPILVKCKEEFVLRWGLLPSMLQNSSNTTLTRLSNLTESKMPPPPTIMTIDNFSGLV
jgi:hypothetical protein